ncbi:MAG: class I SAM-dependent methyltransferase [Chloroflexota bacterium]|nr:class I SAM-dependent methyltransferase [Chloroflexota bacterium]
MTDRQHASSAAEIAKQRVREQYGSVGNAYVQSVGHATGSDLERMVLLAEPRPTDTLIDIATGGGHVARVFAPMVASVIVSDLTPEILEHAETYLTGLGLTNVRFEVVDAEDIPHDDGAFDIVTCRIAPHHFPNPRQFVAEVARVLKQGGRFVLVDSTVPEGEAGAFFNRFEKLRDPSHVESLTLPAWRELLNDQDLTLVATESFAKRHDFEDWISRSRVTVDTRMELERMLIDADPTLRHAFDVRPGADDSQPVAGFSDTKTLFVATK